MSGLFSAKLKFVFGIDFTSKPSKSFPQIHRYQDFLLNPFGCCKWNGHIKFILTWPYLTLPLYLFPSPSPAGGTKQSIIFSIFGLFFVENMSHFMYGRKYVPFYVLVVNMSVEKTSQNASRVVTYDRKIFLRLAIM